jgi:hypothetical protein
VIVRKSKLLVLKQLEIPEPVPMRPHGYFDDCYDKMEAKASNKLAARSARKLVKSDGGRSTSSLSRRKSRTPRLSSPTTSVV